ncbi:MAG: hypothetical protein IJ100_02685, partial [Lachnospiraceae bacterium]|nr:hypothetical protein [Lachnospiraceae bacterium]
KERWSYYDAHAQQRWGQAKNYDLTINSAVLGIDGSVAHILSFLEDFERKGGEKVWMKGDLK